MVPQPMLNEDAAWKRRFRAPVVALTQLAKANPERGLAMTNQSGAVQLYAWHVPSGDLRQVTFKPTGKGYGYISPNGEYIYYLEDEAGNEIGHWVRVPWTGGDAQDVTPDMPPYAAMGLSVSHNGSHLATLMADQAGFHLTTLKLGAEGTLGQPREVWASRRLTSGPTLSPNGELGLVYSSERSGKTQFSLLALDLNSGQVINELWDGLETSVEGGRFSPLDGDARVAAVSTRTGVRRPLLWNPRTGERSDLQLDTVAGDIEIVDWSPDGSHLLLCQFSNAVHQFYSYDLADNSYTRLNHPAGTYGFFGGAGVYYASNEEIFAQWADADHPSCVIALDAQTGEMTRTVLSAGDAPGGRPWRSVVFPSSDGQMIQAWLATPDGDGPFPTILHTHGGPTAVQTAGYSAELQMFLDHGFAVLSVNYRGSTTFGRAFQDQIQGDLGHWEVEDIAAGHQWLVDQGIARTDQIFLTGWSYGGYMTLMGLGKRPDLWAGGMAGIAIADWTVQYEDTAPTLRGYQVALLGGTPEEKPDVYRASSPITYLENVAAPLLVIQGSNDTRCPARPMHTYADRMRELGRDFEIVWFEAGHGALSMDDQIAHREAMLKFAYRVLGQQSAQS